MGNQASGTQAKNPPTSFHNLVIPQNETEVKLKPSTTTTTGLGKEDIDPNLTDMPGLSRPNTSPMPNNSDNTDSEVLPSTELAMIASLSTTKVEMNKHMRKAMDLTPNENIVSHIENVFHYKRQLAKGSSCCVLLTQHRDNKKMYALKEMDRLSKWSPILYLTEIKVLKILKNHPNVMTYFDCFIDDKCLYIASEYCSGGTLLDRIIKMNVFTEEIAAKYITTILSAVNFMHQRNVCHRDLKLNNIVFDKKGSVFVLLCLSTL